MGFQLAVAKRGLRRLVQIAGSQHRWFEDRGEPCTLLVFIDDSTSKLRQLLRSEREHVILLEALEGYLQTHGRTVALYSDKLSIFRMNRAAADEQGLRKVGSAFAELNMESLREDLVCKGVEWNERIAPCRADG